MGPRKFDDRVSKPNVLVETRLQNAVVEKRDNNKIEVIKIEITKESKEQTKNGNSRNSKKP